MRALPSRYRFNRSKVNKAKSNKNILKPESGYKNHILFERFVERNPPLNFNLYFSFSQEAKRNLL